LTILWAEYRKGAKQAMVHVGNILNGFFKMEPAKVNKEGIFY
jgi:hypothetical protein